jgi:hypothetical protein
MMDADIHNPPFHSQRQEITLHDRVVLAEFKSPF